jgi:hypothetical protein
VVFRCCFEAEFASAATKEEVAAFVHICLQSKEELGEWSASCVICLLCSLSVGVVVLRGLEIAREVGLGPVALNAQTTNPLLKQVHRFAM